MFEIKDVERIPMESIYMIFFRGTLSISFLIENIEEMYRNGMMTVVYWELGAY